MIPATGNKNPLFIFPDIISQLQFLISKKKTIIKSLHLDPMSLMDHIFR
jgi:hypothetical protein